MSSLFALRTLLLAGECLAASVVLPALAFVAVRFVRDASLRHMVWLTAFGTLLIFPLASLIVPPQIVIDRAAEVADTAPSVPMMIVPSAEAAPAEAPAASTLPEITLDEVALALLVVWLAGVCWAGSRLMIGAFGLHLLRRQSRPHALPAADLPDIVMHRRECELRLSGAQDGPMTWGVLRPVILLPRTSLAWTRERMQAVLLHELAHVRRRDSLTQSLSLLICALYWPNPLIWLGARALRRDAEIAADDAVLSSGMRPSAYAGELLQLASEFRGHGLAVSGVSMAGRSSLEARVKSVLSANPLRKGVTLMDALKLACLGAVATAALAFVRPDVVDAQNATQPAEPAVSSESLPVVQPAETPAPAETPDAADAPANVMPATAVTPTTPPDRAIHVRPVHHHRHSVTIYSDRDDVHFDQAQMDAAMDQVRRAQDEVRRAQPEIEKALAAAKIDESVARAMRDVEPRVRAEVERAMAKARPAIRQAIAEAHISEKVAKALKDAQPKIDAAIAKAHAERWRAHVVIDKNDAETSERNENVQEDQDDDERDEQ
jgi:beta-lactamase regulating signal transducer with metallopeptidase domain